MSELCINFQHLFPTVSNPIRILKALEKAGMTSSRHLKAFNNLMPVKINTNGMRYIISYLRSGNMTSPEHLELLSQLMPKNTNIDTMKCVLMCLAEGELSSFK
ncbi:MAG TPA: hypothetical protein DD412_08220 [Holosporales bacterium]|nr:hypothetical protein [Holosporales bacterium]